MTKKRKPKSNRLIKIAITSGDQDGIGPEVCAKALHTLGPKKNILFYVWRSSRFGKKNLRLIDKKFSCVSFTNWQQALEYKPKNNTELVDVNSKQSPPQWVETCAQLGHFGHIDALVTGPLSKTLIQSTGMKDIGHTDILSRVTGSKDLFMTFLGNKFNVLIATGHIPLQKVPSQLSARKLSQALRAAELLKLGLDHKSPITLLGLNPHAGEQGLIGSEELSTFTPVLTRLKKEGLSASGPLVPDAAFLEKNWSKYSVFVCPYHDQGLIAFKLAHQHASGCHMTMGLPFIRTSVEHGTAKDIFGKNIANSNSMHDAIKWAIKLAKSSFVPNLF